MVEKLLNRYKSDGLRGVFWVSLRKLLGDVVVFYNIYQIDTEKITRPNANYFTYTVCNELPEPKVYGDLERTKKTFATRLHKNHIYVLAKDNDESIAMLWAHTEPEHREDQYGFLVPVKDNQVYYYDSVTREPWQKKGVLRGMLYALAECKAKQRNISKIVAVIETTNFISQMAHEKIGFKKVKLKMHVRVMKVSRSITLNGFFR
ncbi:GNAT family N-acetyltransferase [Marinobacter sp. X15-166B]|uniref:GNAT family N-acetyltransferase n=1 Tax=Marinobacter sp. X15-166B TaxID=1897620 RepID=UPI00085CCDBC|nr:GNAT family N-acetyltransferase [Marinobacter sp. X15-166B]OEY67752.1 hypothetical protein BG841_15825 [Marinobacter sp. X15-166B]